MRLSATIAVILAAAAAVLGQNAPHSPKDPELSFLSEAKIAQVPFTIANNLIIVKASVNGASPASFIFDTGAESTVIDTGLALSLSLKRSGTTLGTGSAGTATAGIFKGATLQIGDLKAENVTLYSLPLSSFTPNFGIKIAGIIGNDITRQLVADIDYENTVLHLITPASFTPPEGIQALPITIEGNLPFVKTKIAPHGREAVQAKLELDTGSTGTVLFNSPFVTRQRLVSTFRNSMNAKTGGVGGTGASTVGRITSLELGRTTIFAPIAILYRGTRGDNASSTYDGLLGGAIFRRFRMTIDMPGKRVFFKPTASLTDAFDTDMSGLELLADGADLRTILVDNVFAASTGAKAGIKGGDVIETIDGRPATEIGLQEVRRMFRQDGAEYELGVRRGKELMHVKLRLTRVI